MLELGNFDKFVEKHWLAFLLVFSGLPGLTLLVRGLVWGADSFAFWGFSCGFDIVSTALGSPVWFLWFIKNVVACNLFVLAFVMFFLYFFALLGVYFFGKRFFAHQAYRLPLYVVCLVPLFFIEAIRFENDFFGWGLAFVALGCFSLFIEKRNVLALFLALILAFFSVNLWFPSVFILLLAVFLLDLDKRVYLLMIGIGVLALIVFKRDYFVYSFEMLLTGKIVAEEMPLLGLIFILPIIQFYKNIPSTLKIYGILLIFLGAVKAKYMFLSVPLLLMGLMAKEDIKPLSLKREIFGIKEIPVLFICFFLIIGWFIMGISLYPNHNDFVELKSAIKLAEDNNIPLYNDWGDGWMLESIGYPTKYKITAPQPDWNNLSRPYVAWAKIKIIGCVEVAKHTQKC